jgi:hypothetical protein
VLGALGPVVSLEKHDGGGQASPPAYVFFLDDVGKKTKYGMGAIEDRGGLAGVLSESGSDGPFFFPPSS